MKPVFDAYNGTQTTMDGKTFLKLCNDAKLPNKECKTTQIDLIFAKVKAKSERRINFEQFKEAVALVEKARFVAAGHDVAKICKLQGPVLKGTVAQANKFHDDKSLYTGVHAKGGPTTVDRNSGVVDMAAQLDRNDADIRGVKHYDDEEEVKQVTKKMNAVVVEEKKTAPKKKVTKEATTKSAPAGSL